MNSAVAVPDTEDQQALVGAVGGLLAMQWGMGAARALGGITDGGAPGPEHSVIKLAWSTTMQAIGATHLAALGLDSITPTRGRQAHHDYLMSRSAIIAGGTTEIMRNILAERVLAMPR